MASTFSDNAPVIGCFVIGAAIVLMIVVYIFALHATAEEVTIHVNKLDDQAHGNGHKYMVFAEGEVFEDTDSIIFLKNNSSDVWGELKEGHSYVVEVAGWRSTWFSSYRNIIDVKQEVK